MRKISLCELTKTQQSEIISVYTSTEIFAHEGKLAQMQLVNFGPLKRTLNLLNVITREQSRTQAETQS